MYYFCDTDRKIGFRTARELKEFLCGEYSPVALARAVASDMIDHVLEMGYDEMEDLRYDLTRALLGETDMEDQLMNLIEYLGMTEEEIEMEGTGATIGYCEEGE
nr:MAG TPA: hypothetical protein [Caudoviricetes sp.]